MNKVKKEIEERRFEEKSDQNPIESKQAEEKYKENRKTKTPKVIAENFAPREVNF